MTSPCNFCGRQIAHGRVSAHYRYKHKPNDISPGNSGVFYYTVSHNRERGEPRRTRRYYSLPAPRNRRVIGTRIEHVNIHRPGIRRLHRAREVRRTQRNGRNVQIPEPATHNVIERKQISVHLPSITPVERAEPEIKSSNCVMCLEDHMDILQPCGHSDSCGPCLNRWWRQSYHNPRCPICRTETDAIHRKGSALGIVTMWHRWRKNQIRRSQGVRRRERFPSLM